MAFWIKAVGVYVLKHILHIEATQTILDAQSHSAICATYQPVPVVTVGAVSSSVWSLTMSASKSYRVAGQILSNGNGAWTIAGVFDVDSSGVVTSRLTPSALAVGTAGTATLALALVGLVLTATGTGVAATNITWLATVQVTEVGI